MLLQRLIICATFSTASKRLNCYLKSHNSLTTFENSYSNADYRRSIKKNTEPLIGRNVQLRAICNNFTQSSICTEPEFLQNACIRFPVILAKVVRLRLMSTIKLLNDPSLNHLQIVYLVRDPRGTINSRFGVIDWCGKSEDCIDPRKLCGDISNDLEAFALLAASFPGRLSLLKYETLANRPYETFQQIFNFIDLPFLAPINKTIADHTSRNKVGSGSTHRYSFTRSDLWKRKLNRTKIAEIQKACTGVHEKLGQPLM